MMILKDCPHCKKAFQILEDLKVRHPEYHKTALIVIDEQEHPQTADSLDYWYVPSFFVGEKTLHEGIPTPESIENVFRYAMNNNS